MSESSYIIDNDVGVSFMDSQESLYDPTGRVDKKALKSPAELFLPHRSYPANKGKFQDNLDSRSKLPLLATLEKIVEMFMI